MRLVLGFTSCCFLACGSGQPFRLVLVVRSLLDRNEQDVRRVFLGFSFLKVLVFPHRYYTPTFMPYGVATGKIPCEAIND